MGFSSEYTESSLQCYKENTGNAKMLVVLFHFVLLPSLLQFSHCTEDRMFSYNSSSLIKNVDDYSIKLVFSSGIPLGKIVHHNAYVYSNGYITFSSFYHYHKPSFANNHQIVAGYGTDLDFRNGIGGFSAAVHESNATDEISLKVFNETNNYLEKYANVTDFSPRTIILCTWYKASPYRASLSNKNETVYFQINIATDGYATHISFVYQDGGMLWKNLRYYPRLGYAINTVKGRTMYEQILNNTGNQRAYRFDAVVGNTGFKGRWSWKIDINQCNSTAPCPANASCIRVNGIHFCECELGYSKQGDTCNDKNECSERNPCHANATCSNNAGSYSCQCNDGFSGNGTVCSDVDECATLGQHSCHANATCSNNAGSYSCQCNDGFSGNGTVCSDVDECATPGQYSCHSYASCLNTVGSYSCSCNNGFTGDRTVCTDIDECTLKQHSCNSNATCSNSIGSFLCQCKNGFAGDGTVCLSLGICKSNPCKNGGSCVTKNGKEICTCLSGLTGATCEIQLFSMKGKAFFRSVYLHGMLINLAKQATRDDLRNRSSKLYTDLRRSIEQKMYKALKLVRPNVDSVTATDIRLGSVIVNFQVTYSIAVNETLEELRQVFARALNASFSGELMQMQLTDYDECSTNKYCHQHANCLNTITSFVCSCKDGYTGNGFVCTRKKTDNNDLAIGLSLAFLVPLFLLVVVLLTKRRSVSKSHQTEKSLEYTTDRSMRAQQINLSYTTGDCEKLEFSKIAPQAVNSINEDTVKI